MVDKRSFFTFLMVSVVTVPQLQLFIIPPDAGVQMVRKGEAKLNETLKPFGCRPTPTSLAMFGDSFDLLPPPCCATPNKKSHTSTNCNDAYRDRPRTAKTVEGSKACVCVQWARKITRYKSSFASRLLSVSIFPHVATDDRTGMLVCVCARVYMRVFPPVPITKPAAARSAFILLAN